MSQDAPYSQDLDWPATLAPFEALDPAIQADPFPHYAWMRENAPVVRSRSNGVDVWFVARRGDVEKALLIPRRVSSETIDPNILPFIILMDPPRHTRMREVVARAFTPKAIAKFETQVGELAAHHLRPILARGRGEIVGEFAMPLTMATIGSLLGAPESDLPALLRMSDDTFNYMGRIARRANGSSTDEAGFREFLSYLGGALRAAGERDDGSVMANLARLCDRGSMDEREAAHFCAFLFVAGHETTTMLIGNGFRTVAEQPDLLARLREGPSEVAKFVEELARFRGVPQRLARVARGDIELSGFCIPDGAEIRLLRGSADRDSARFPDGERFDLGRDTTGHFGFGHGIHSCIGAWLARLETRTAFAQLAESAGHVALDDASPIVPYLGGTLSNTGPRSMGVTIARR